MPVDGIALGTKPPSKPSAKPALAAEATRMFREAAEASEVVRAQLARHAPLVSALAQRLRPAPRGGDLWARQLRPRGDLRPVPDRDAAWCDDLVGRALGEFGL